MVKVYNTLKYLAGLVAAGFSGDATRTRLALGANCLVVLDDVSLPHLNRLYVLVYDAGSSFSGTGGAMERAGQFSVTVRNKLAVTQLGDLAAFSQELLNVSERIRGILHNNANPQCADLIAVASEAKPRFEQHTGASGELYYEGAITATYSYVVTLDAADVAAAGITITRASWSQGPLVRFAFSAPVRAVDFDPENFTVDGVEGLSISQPLPAALDVDFGPDQQINHPWTYAGFALNVISPQSGTTVEVP